MVNLTGTPVGDAPILLYPNGSFIIEDYDKVAQVIGYRNHVSIIKGKLKGLRNVSVYWFHPVTGFVKVINKLESFIDDLVNHVNGRLIVFSSPKGDYGFNYFKASNLITDSKKLLKLIKLVNVYGLSNEDLVKLLNKRVDFKSIPVRTAGSDELSSYFDSNTFNQEVLSEVNELSLGRVNRCDDFHLINEFPLTIIRSNEGLFYNVANNLSLRIINKVKFFIGEFFEVEDNLMRRGRVSSFFVSVKLSDYDSINRVKSMLESIIESIHHSSIFMPVIFFKDEKSSFNDLSLLMNESLRSDFLKVYFKFIGPKRGSSDGWLFNSFKEVAGESVAVKSREVFLKSFKKLIVKKLRRGGNINRIIVSSFLEAVSKEFETLNKFLIKSEGKEIKVSNPIEALSVMRADVKAFNPLINTNGLGFLEEFSA